MLSLALVSPASAQENFPKSFPLARTEKENRPTLSFAIEQPFQLDFGRGSGWGGLDTVSIDADGNVSLSRTGMELQGKVRVQYVETASLRLSSSSLKNIGKAIHDCGLLQMQRAYHADVLDGRQWIFWLRQGSGEKSIYFNNHFPAGILRFAKILDKELDAAGFKNTQWKRMERGQIAEAAKALWKSVE